MTQLIEVPQLVLVAFGAVFGYALGNFLINLYKATKP